VSDTTTGTGASAANVAAEGCSCSRRAFLQIAIGTSVTLSAARADEPSAESSALPKAGDRLVFAEGDRSGREIKPEDMVLGEQQIMAWPLDPASKEVRSGSRLNEILLLRLEPDTLDEGTRPYAADGIVAYSAICKHAQCPVNGWNREKQLLHCFCHASEYDPRKSAAVVSGPAPRPLPILPLKIVDGALTVAAPLRGKVGNRSV
jgi:rieske iron-sulfur protein